MKPAKRKIVMVYSPGKFGGVERRFVKLYDWLAAKEANLILMCNRNAVEQVKHYVREEHWARVVLFEDCHKDHKVKLLRIICLSYTLISLYMRLLKMNPVSIHMGSNPNWITTFLMLAPFIKARITHSAVDSTKNTYDDYSFTEKLHYRLAIQGAVSIDCLSQEIKCSLLKIYPDILNGKEGKLLTSPCSFIAGAHRQRISRNKIIDLLMVARFVKLKGYELFFNAIPFLKHKELNIHLCGFGPLAKEIIEKAKKINDHYIKVYYAENPVDIISASKIFLSLQEYENYPSQSLLEAMMVKTSVIATDVGSTRELLDEHNAILVKKDAAELAGAIDYLLEDKSKRTQFADKAYNVCLQKHSIERFGDYFVTNFLQS